MNATEDKSAVTIGGLRRAADWLEANEFHDYLAIHKSQKTGAKVILDIHLRDGEEKLKQITSLFAGKKATRTEIGSLMSFRCETDGLIFEWSVFKPAPIECVEPETITL